MMAVLPLHYYRTGDTLQLARELLGKKLCTRINGHYTAGYITETEAYRARDDRACHAHLNKRTGRTRVMFEPGGLAYVYLCYGIHHLFNIVTRPAGEAEAILIRAIAPAEGLTTMLQRRKLKRPHPRLSSGPGCLSQALGITTALYGQPLNSPELWLEDAPLLPERQVGTTTRIGVEYAGEDALLPWRFYDQSSAYVSQRPSEVGR